MLCTALGMQHSPMMVMVTLSTSGVAHQCAVAFTPGKVVGTELDEHSCDMLASKRLLAWRQIVCAGDCVWKSVCRWKFVRGGLS